MDTLEILSTSDFSDFSAYRDELDALVDGEDDEWLYRISTTDINTKRTLLFSWLSDIPSSEGGGFDIQDFSDSIMGVKPSTPSLDSQWEASIDSLLDFSVLTDVKLFGVTSEEAKNYSAVDLGLDELPDELFEPLGLESDNLQVPQDIQQYIDDFAKQIEESQKLGQFPSHLPPLQISTSTERVSLNTNNVTAKFNTNFSEKLPTSLNLSKSPPVITSPTATSSHHSRSFSTVEKRALPTHQRNSSAATLNSPAGSRIPRFAPTQQPNSLLTSASTSSINSSRRPMSIASPRDLFNPLKAQSTVASGTGLGSGLPHTSKRLDSSTSPGLQSQFTSRIPRFNRSPNSSVHSPSTDVSNRGSRLIAQSALDFSNGLDGSHLTPRHSPRRIPTISQKTTPISSVDNSSASGSSRIPRLSVPRTGATRSSTKSKLTRHSVIY